MIMRSFAKQAHSPITALIHDHDVLVQPAGHMLPVGLVIELLAPSLLKLSLLADFSSEGID
jgi:hypothetical protein